MSPHPGTEASAVTAPREFLCRPILFDDVKRFAACGPKYFTSASTTSTFRMTLHNL
ncbi:hypothetical protein MA6G0728R_0238 [Mycobacteroides abscessus 6G-0728-R]|nr:hypothetical protein MA6G1108_0238 [Mycobacteroides abscessus 6G-1108]EIV02245.1 hypothetical protein MA6G0728R_0238 [Mycobacteroides abscessus 6G-0728-R]EIV58144.1 hypothetical protein MA3A0930S_0287 [Mycobacteroides abscessus 3A-0930-S]EUA72967.1 hypothetical protein I541_5176 [Mycobacteroides abscessus]